MCNFALEVYFVLALIISFRLPARLSSCLFLRQLVYISTQRKSECHSYHIVLGTKPALFFVTYYASKPALKNYFVILFSPNYPRYVLARNGMKYYRTWLFLLEHKSNGICKRNDTKFIKFISEVLILTFISGFVPVLCYTDRKHASIKFTQSLQSLP